VREAATTAILEAAEEVLAERGPEATSIAAIASRAGVAVGTLYNYFPDRESMLGSLFRMRREQLIPRITEAAKSAGSLPFEQRLRTYVAGVLAAFEERRRFVEVVVAVDPKFLKEKDRKPTTLHVFLDCTADILRPVCGKQTELYAQILVGALKQVMTWRVEQGEPLAGDADLLVDTFLRGIPRRG
jgi:AcrR family transcriptional regulator